MNFRETLLAEHSIAQTSLIVKYIGKDKVRFNKLFDLFLGGEYRVGQRASWAISHSVEAHPELLETMHYQHLHKALDAPAHISVRRNILRFLQFVDIPEQWQGHIYDRAMHYFMRSKEPVAVRVFSMQLLYDIGSQIPELNSELIELLNDIKDHDRAGIRSRARRLLKQLNNQNSR